MGAALTLASKTSSEDEESLPPKAKRARLDPNLCSETSKSDINCSSNATSASSKTDQFVFTPSPRLLWLWPTSSASGPGFQQAKWENLPYVALVEIFRRLPNTDKYSAALACRAWQLPFHRPALWRRGNFRFNGQNEWRALTFVSLMGPALRHVTIDCSAEFEVRHGPAAQSAKNLSIFLTCLVNSQNSQVSTFKLTHLRRLVKHLAETEGDLVQLLSSFLTAQKNLTSLDLQHAGLSADQAFQLLESAATSSESSVRVLSISEIICPLPGYEVALDPRLLILLAPFTALTELSISYCYLSDDLLFLLACTVTLTLTQIAVWAGYVGRVEGRTSSRAWRHLVIRCPRLGASFAVKSIKREQCFKGVLTPGTPLTRLQLSIGGFTTVSTTAACFDHIISHFHESLQHFEFDLHIAKVDVGEDLAALVKQCYNLKTLHLASSVSDFGQELCVKRAVRRAVARQPRSKLKVVTFNGEEVDVKETWTTTFVDWLTEKLQ
ncbi:hypothetical protein RRG08_022928 [Elysia crispata]|uniref:F-box domain-containing protein n=1 Tax=Elysia crispata TaxID=231223 RepID=A0AAE1CJE6_9GAST|nr:hypothetical protein RRG08_022928 [Elysia crispata]